MNIGMLSWVIDEKRTGIGNYAHNLIKNLIKFKKYGNISLIHYNKTQDTIYDNVNDIVIPKIAPLLTNLIGMPYAINKADIDILHAPSHGYMQTSSFFFNGGVKKILTIHDLTPLLFPETHSKETLFFWNSTLKLIKNRADIIIVDSKNTKNDCIMHLGISDERIKVVHLAADSKYKPINNKENIEKELKNKYNLKFPFILYVGTLERRKNISTLIKAFYKLKKNSVKHKLVIAGGKGWKYNEIFETIDKLGLKNDVIFTGYVPDEDLVKLYNAADLFVYPSLYEGFGLPPLEAMACGCPVITSNASSLPEVVGNAGIMVDPYNFDILYEKICEVLSNNGFRDELRKKSLNRAKLFSWEKTAEETCKIYEEVLNRK